MYKKDVSRAAWAVLIMLVLANLLAFVIVLGLSVRVGLGGEMNLSESLYNFVAAYLPTLLAEGVLIVLLHFWCGFRISGESGTRTKEPVRLSLQTILGGWGAAAAASFLVSILLQVMSAMGLEMSVPDISVPMPQTDPLGFALTLGYVGILGPILEELIFRGYILNGLKKYGEWAAILTSAIFFTMFHGNLTQLLAPWIIGMLFGFLAIRTGSLLPSILCHIFHNTLLIFMEFLPEFPLQIVFSVYALVGIGGLIWYICRYHTEWKALKQAQKDEYITELLLAPGFIAYFILYVILCALYFIV